MAAANEATSNPARVLAQKIQGGAPLDRLRPLLEPGRADPEAFQRDLIAAINRRGPSLTSRPGMTTSFYQDLVGRHLISGGTAIIYRDQTLGWREMTYRDLHNESSKLASTWTSRAVQAGQRIAVVMPVGGPMAVSLLTALRLGLLTVFIPPLGRAFVQHRLQSAGVDWVVTQTGYGSWLDVPPETVLPATADAGAVPDLGLASHPYEADDPALGLFSPLGPEPEAMVERASGAWFGRVAADAELVYGFSPTDRVAAPGYDPLQHQPSLLFATLFAGACFIEVPTTLLDDDDLMARLRLTFVGVTGALRDGIMSGQPSTKGWRRWFKSPAEPYDWEAWRRFGERMSANGIWGQNVLTSAAYGGALAFSAPEKSPQLEVLPGPGIPWTLSESMLSDHETSSDSGILRSDEPDAPESAIGRFTLGDGGGALFVAGSADEGRGGTTFPCDEVVRAVEGHPAVDGAVVVINRAVRILNLARVVLVIFVDPAADPTSVEERLIKELETLIKVEMGREHLPDQVRIYPLAPRRDEDGAVDVDWCRWQFLTGELQMKASDELFRLASVARRHVQRFLQQGTQ